MGLGTEEGTAALALCRGGGSPAAQGWGVRAWGLRWEVRKGAVGLNWVEEGRRRSSTGAGGRRRLYAAAAAPRRWRRDEAGPCGFSRAVWWWFGARWRLEWGGGASSSSAHQWRAAVVLGVRRGVLRHRGVLWRASRGPGSALMGGRARDEGLGRAGAGAWRPQCSAGRGCRRAAVGTRRAWAERSVSDGKARRVLEWGS